MVKIDIAYQGELRCQATHLPSGTLLTTDAPVDNQGKGASFSPTDLVATALATCIATTLGIVAPRVGFDPTGMTVTVGKEMTSAPPRRIARLEVQVHLPQDVPVALREKVESIARACPVQRSLHPDVVVPITFRYGPAPSP